MSTVAESHKLKIAVFTSTRAEYGMLQPLLLMLQESARFHLELVVSGTHLSDDHGSLHLNYVGKVHQAFGRRFNGYTPLELLHIEATFLKACDYELPFRHNHKRPENPKDKDLLFNGLSEVVRFLCQLDGVPNVMDYTRLFETENDRPKYELTY